MANDKQCKYCHGDLAIKAGVWVHKDNRRQTCIMGGLDAEPEEE